MAATYTIRDTIIEDEIGVLDSGKKSRMGSAIVKVQVDRDDKHPYILARKDLQTFVDSEFFIDMSGFKIIEVFEIELIMSTDLRFWFKVRYFGSDGELEPVISDKPLGYDEWNSSRGIVSYKNN